MMLSYVPTFSGNVILNIEIEKRSSFLDGKLLLPVVVI
jgi:hypothetical protein